MVPGLSSTLPKATLYAFLPIQIIWKFKKLGENQNPIQDFVNKVKDVNKNFPNFSESFEIGSKNLRKLFNSERKI